MQHRLRPVLALLTACAVTALLGPAVYARQASHPEDVCLTNLKQLGLATLMYVQDNDEKFPPTTNLPHLKSVLMPYMKSSGLFTCPVTHLPYRANPAVSMKSLGSFKAPATAPVFCDARPHADGTYDVVYIDGHAKRVKTNPLPAAQKGHGKP